METVSIPILHWKLDGPEASELLVIWAQFNFGFGVSPNQLAWFLRSRSQFKVFYSCWKNQPKLSGYFPSVES